MNFDSATLDDYKLQTDGSLEFLFNSIDWDKTLAANCVLQQGQYFSVAKVVPLRRAADNRPWALKFLKCDRVGGIFDWRRCCVRLVALQNSDHGQQFSDSDGASRSALCRHFDGRLEKTINSKACQYLQKKINAQTLHLLRHTQALQHIAQHYAANADFCFVQAIADTKLRNLRYVCHSVAGRSSCFWEEEKQMLAKASLALNECESLQFLPRLYVIESWIESVDTETLFGQRYLLSVGRQDDWSFRITAAQKVFAAYRFLHESCRLVHHDVSFANVRFVLADGADDMRVFVNDFGFSQHLPPTDTDGNSSRRLCVQFAGSGYFASPQKWERVPHDDEKDECFAIGVLVHFILYGTLCWPKSVTTIKDMSNLLTKDLKSGSFVPAWNAFVNAPNWVNEIVTKRISKLLSYSESQRPSMSQILSDLESGKKPE